MYSATQHARKELQACHGCRSVGNFFGNCPIKLCCPCCVHGFHKFFEVERDTVKKGKYFKCCSEKCGFWEWCNDGEAAGESSNGRVTLGETMVRKEVEDMSRMLQSQVRLNNEEKLLISVNVNGQSFGENTCRSESEGDGDSLISG